MHVPSLAFFLIVIIILIALTEYACHALPVASSQGIISGLNVRSIIKRQNYADNYTSTIVTQWVALCSVLYLGLTYLIESEEPGKLLLLST
jgi:hypothetical protein